MSSSFGFSFSSEKRKRADEKGCAVVWKYKGWKEKKEDGKAAKKQVSTLLHSPHPLALLFPLKKRTCVSLRTPKRVEDPEKTDNYSPPKPSSFGFSFPSEKRTCAYLGTERKRKKWGERQRSPLFLPFFLKKECVHLYTRSTPWEICACMGTEKEETEMAKRQIITLFRGHHPLAFLFPLQ